MNIAENNLWNHAIVTIYWRADRHEESHSITYKRPTEENPFPDHPVKVGGCLSTSPLPMSSEWGGLFSKIIVKAFDECGPIGEGMHERFIIDTAKFAAKALSKTATA
jgi:hypothetical protein